MKRTVALITVPLLALLTAIAVRRMLRARQSVVPQPNGAEAMVEPTQAKTDEESVSHQNTAPVMSQAAEASPQQVEPTSLLGSGNMSISKYLRPIYDAIETSYASTVAAFALHGEEADYETHDAQAQQDAARLQQLFSSMRADLSPELTSSCEAIIDRIASAQLQLMAFAINRKKPRLTRQRTSGSRTC